MVNFRRLAASLAVSSIVGSVFAHPGEVHTEEEMKREIDEHVAAQVKARASLAACSSSPAALALRARAIERRAATAQALREKRGIVKSTLQLSPALLLQVG